MAISNAQICAFCATVDAARARAFYEGVLGLRLVEEGPFALVFDANGVMLRLQKVQDLKPAPFTALGWNVADIQAEVRALAARGLTFARFAHFAQDEDGIWTTPDGAKVAWFRDPDGNLLSLAQHPARG